jgi:hypothetical protein
VKLIRPTTITVAMLVASSVSEDDYAEYNAGTTYTLDQYTISTTTHRIYKSLQNSNTGHALSDTAWWQDVGATNRWKMFDGGVSVQTQDPDVITAVLTPGRIDSVALLNIDAASYQVTLTANAESPTEIVYDTGVVATALESNISDWYQYFFEPTSERKTDITLTDLPQYVNGILTVTLLSATATVSIGELVVGTYRELGDLQWGARVGIIDYSVKETDAFGNASVVERAYSKRLSGEVFVENVSVDATVLTLARYRSTAVVWIGTTQFTSTIIFGFFRSFEVVIATPMGSFCNLEIEGII